MDRKKQLKEIKRRNSKAYNAMPESARIIAGRVIGEMRIYQLTREKARMKKAYTNIGEGIKKKALRFNYF